MVSNALNNISDALTGKKPLSSQDKRSVTRLFGDSGLSQQGLNAIKNTLEKTRNAIAQSLSNGGANVRFGRTRPDASAHADGSTGQITLNPGAFANISPEKASEIMTHEFTHIGAGTKDNHYLDENDNMRANLSGTLSPYAYNNADSFSRLTARLDS